MNNELKHYGISGQKWGVRRWQNADGSFNEEGKIRYGRVTKFVSGKQAKEISRERTNLKNKYREETFKEFAKSDPELAKAMKLREKAFNLASKYHLDMDDGGGNHTPAGEKAGREYMKLWDQISAIEDRIDTGKIYKAADKKVENALNKKYGEDVMAAYNRRTNLISGMTSVGVLLGTIGSMYITAKAIKGISRAGEKALIGGLELAGKGIQHLIDKRK